MGKIALAPTLRIKGGATRTGMHSLEATRMAHGQRSWHYGDKLQLAVQDSVEASERHLSLRVTRLLD